MTQRLALPSVNLVPSECRDRMERRRRLQTWCAVAVSLCGVLMASVFLRGALSAAFERMATQISEAESARRAVNQSLVSLRSEWNDLAVRLRLIAGLRQPQPWPERIATIVRLAPASVTLTDLRVEPAAPSAPAAPPTTPAALAPGGAKPATPAGAAERPTAMVVSLKGIARDNEGLSAFVAKLQTIPGCERVEMQEVSRQGEGESQGMSFSLECRIRESGR